MKELKYFVDRFFYNKESDNFDSDLIHRCGSESLDLQTQIGFNRIWLYNVYIFLFCFNTHVIKYDVLLYP